MPPRTRYTPDRIVDAAERVLEADGLSAVSARSVAAALGCSTAPVFTQFASMEALHERVLDRIIARFVAATTAASASHEDPLIGAGLGMVRFAAEHPRQYAALFLTHHPWHHKWGPVRRELARRMGDHPRYAGLSERQRFALVGRSSVVVHGLGVEIWSGRLRDASEPTLLRLLDQLAVPLVDAALAHGWTDDIHSTPEPGAPGAPEVSP